MCSSVALPLAEMDQPNTSPAELRGAPDKFTAIANATFAFIAIANATFAIGVQKPAPSNL